MLQPHYSRISPFVEPVPTLSKPAIAAPSLVESDPALSQPATVPPPSQNPISISALPIRNCTSSPSPSGSLQLMRSNNSLIDDEDEEDMIDTYDEQKCHRARKDHVEFHDRGGLNGKSSKSPRK
ncbi:hypothetical protein LINGRAHAP2_LOCUS32180 [Linum grandiflorum]